MKIDLYKFAFLKFIETYGSNIISTQTHDVNRVLNVLNRLVSSNKDIKEIAETNWHITLIKEDIVNAAAFPVIILIEASYYLYDN